MLIGNVEGSWGADCTSPRGIAYGREFQLQLFKNKDFDKYKKISACMAKQNKARGFAGLGFCARTGRCGGNKDLNAAVKYYTRAAKMGLIASQYWLTIITTQSKNFKPNYTYVTSLLNNPRIPQKAKKNLQKAKNDLTEIRNLEKIKQAKKKDDRRLKAQKRQQKLNRFWRKYENKEKSLAEKVLNYTITNKLNGDAGSFWVSDKKNPCVLQVYGTKVPFLQKTGVIKKKIINLKKINQTAFSIGREHKPRTFLYNARWYFVLKSGPIIYFQVATSSVDESRLIKAWRLAFEKCPGKKSAF